MFERYTEKARRAIFYARYRASEFGSETIDTEHLLLALLQEGKAQLGLFLPSGVSEEWVQQQIEEQILKREQIPTHIDLPLSDGLKRVLAYAAEEAYRLGHQHIGPEHLFLGLLREEKCFAAGLLREQGAKLDPIRMQIAEAPPYIPSQREETEGRTAFSRARGETRAVPPPQTGQAGPNSSPSRMASFERYSEKARRAIFFARYEASQLGSPYIESEHLLLGMLREEADHLSRFFPSSLDIDSIRKEIGADPIIREKPKTSVDLALSIETMRALGFGAEEAERLASPQVCSEHLLLGILRVEGSKAAQMLLKRGADVDRIRWQLAGPPPGPTPEGDQPS
jgi:ATP-dependent Clp protease ATP-binding subunit ClpA